MSDNDVPESPDHAGHPVPAEAAVPASGSDTYLPGSNWSYGAIAAALLSGFVAVSIAAPIIVATTSWATVEEVPIVALLALQHVANLLVLGWLSRSRGSRSWRRDFGLEFTPRQAWGLLAGFAIQFLVALLLTPLVRFLGEDRPQQAIAQETASLEGWELAAIAVLVVAVGPLVEEIIYRGMLLGRLVNTMSPGRAIAVSAAFFALIHLADPNALLVVPGLFVIGLVLGYVAIRTGNIGLATFIHAGSNALAVIALIGAEELEEVAETVEAMLTWLWF